MFQDWTIRTKLNHVSLTDAEMPLSASAFCCSCGGKFVNEIETFLTSIRAFHDNHIYMLTDKAGEKEINRVKEKYKFENITVFAEVDENYVSNVKKRAKRIKSHNGYWSVTWIYAKLDIFERALAAEEKKRRENEFKTPRGVLLLDSDIILCKEIDEKFDADLVLSAHSLTDPLRKSHNTYGFYNAGMILASYPSIARHWMKIFLEGGENTFYEQSILEDLTKKWVCDVFSENHNFGKWRREDLAMSRRKVRSFHLHANEDEMYPEQPFNHKMAFNQADKNKEICLSKVK